MTDPKWLAIGRRYIGQREFPVGSNPFIASLWINYVKVWQALGADDSTAPWCGIFCGYCIERAELALPAHPYRARAWLDWGTVQLAPAVGSIAVFARSGGGHVGFVIGQDQFRNLMVLGGNQKDAVSIAPFGRDRLLGYRWPKGAGLYPLGFLPIVDSNGQVSTNEA